MKKRSTFSSAPWMGIRGAEARQIISNPSQVFFYEAVKTFAKNSLLSRGRD